MQRRTAAALLVTTLFALLPYAQADWMGRGFYEPDTMRDKTDGFMWLDPDVSPAGRKVYFSSYSTMYPSPVNPNSGTIGSSILQYPTDIHAILGVWKDCNKDGYVGHAEGVLADYAAALLPDTSVCAPVAVDPSSPGFVPVHNDGTWVRELLVIGPDFHATTAAGHQQPSPENNTYPWNIADESARIWADWDLPESSAPSTCLALPGSRGNLQSSGGFLRWADCLAQWRITGAANTLANTTGVQQIGFNDAQKERPDQSGSLLNQPNPWGQESDDAYASAFDCSEPITHHDDTGATHQTVPNPQTGGVLLYVNLTDEDYNAFLVGTPRAPSVSAAGSPAGTVNETTEAQGITGTCDREDDNGGIASGQIYEAVEGDQEANPVSARVQTGIWFEYAEPNSARCTIDTENAANSDCPDGTYWTGPWCTDDEERDCTPYFAGAWPTVTGHGGLVGLNVPGYWRGLPGYVASRNPYISRETLQPWGAVYLTTYAYVDRNLFHNGLSAFQDSFYGGEHCAGTRPVTGIFECDPAKWYVGPNGEDIARTFQVKVHQPYNLRDIDCYDQSPARATGNTVSMSLVGSGICFR